ncbi:MAG: BamA/TamA family outer membrane protein [Myxococcota bacterium]|nr:BamA/TamA family outer membrane protein [Myxococcota bacterium]
MRAISILAAAIVGACLAFGTTRARAEQHDPSNEVASESPPAAASKDTADWIEVQRDENGQNLDLLNADVTSSGREPRYILEKIEIFGNRKTMAPVILEEIKIAPGEVFRADDPRLEKARYRLLALGLFYEVNLSLRKGSRRGLARLVVIVKERNTLVIQDIAFGLAEMNPSGTLSEIIPYGSLDVAERSFLGSGVHVSAAGVWSKDQYGYRLRFSDNHFLQTDFSVHAEGLFAHARDFFGNDRVCKRTCPCDEADPECPDSSVDASYEDYVDMEYNRTGFRMGTGYTVLGDNFLSVDYRLEIIDAAVPPAGSHLTFGERRPIVFGHLLPGYSFLSSVIFGAVRDTRDSFILASEGTRTALEVEFSTEIIGSDYDFAKFTLTHDTYFPLGKGHTLKLGLLIGLIMGEAPFFNQFFVGDFSSFVPSRLLEMNFSPLQPNVLETSIVEMRYEDLAMSIGVEYALPFYRGKGFFYGVNGFVGAGIFALTSQSHLKIDPKGYSGYRAIPMDVTADLGIKVDTAVGLFVVSMGNMFRMIPSVGRSLAE